MFWPGRKMQVTRRFVLQVGFSCNSRCRFCYYKEALQNGTAKDFTTEEVKSKLREGRQLGKNMVDLSGGEPTIRKDIFEICDYARRIGYKTISLITNGIRMGSDKTFCDKLVEAGANDFLFSVHSPVEKDHEWLTQVPGSYKKVLAALEYMSKKKGIICRVNSTISNFNYKTINKLFELVKPYNPAAVNILVLNPSQDTLKGESGVQITDYNEIAKPLAAAIKKYKDDFKVINVRWLPFCLLKGHEERIRTFWQKLYEDEEWDPYLNIKWNMGIGKVVASFLAGCALYPFRAQKYGRRNLYTLFNEILTIFRLFYYYRYLKPCRRCSLRKICTGLPIDYIRKINKTKLQPYDLGFVVNDPLYFCKKYKKNFESLRLNDE